MIPLLAVDYATGGAGAISCSPNVVASAARSDLPRPRCGGDATAAQGLRGHRVPALGGRAAGADLALLIVAALSDAQLAGFLALGRELGITCLVETHTADEVRRALAAGADLIGVNNRNLKTLAVDLAQFELLSDLIGGEAVKVAESGILSIADAERMRAAGADAVLVGEMLVRHGDPTAAVAALRALA